MCRHCWILRFYPRICSSGSVCNDVIGRDDVRYEFYIRRSMASSILKSMCFSTADESWNESFCPRCTYCSCWARTMRCRIICMLVRIPNPPVTITSEKLLRNFLSRERAFPPTRVRLSGLTCRYEWGFEAACLDVMESFASSMYYEKVNW